MPALDSLPPPGFLSHAITWLAVVAGWAASAVWVDRDARRRYGRSQPWKGVMLALGCGLAYAGFSSGIVLVEAIGWLTALAVAAYATLFYVAEREGLAGGQTVRAAQQPYGVAFARAGRAQPFFLVLAEDWQRELPARPVRAPSGG